MKWALFYLLCLPLCLGWPVPGISSGLSLSDKHQGPDQDRESQEKSFGYSQSSAGILSPLLSSSSHDTQSDIDITTSQGHYQHQHQRPITLNQPLSSIPHHDSEYTTSSTSNSDQNTNNDNDNDNLNNNHNNNINHNNNFNSHGTFLTTNTTPASPHQLQQLPPSTTNRYLRVLHQTQLPTTFLKNHMHEIVVVGLFLLVPITLALVEIIERIGLGVDEGIDLEEYLERKRGRGMIRRGRRALRKKRGKKKSRLIQMDMEVDLEDQVFSR
ncbi:hypothetical protein BDV37DRAFT_279513 [Aspergillus pseudonomiae]|uniref:Uncharacterized protein n=1 Tax=Aspergillus pseudonomiae TaxID=1506151 RepID=A0A5N7DMV4_9EURO|nr:uncharacterized protein BDV37DRAFT_279513 [Aspergillus pseudonomiae]KAE8407724.1 hypothetical protein BDV37DRAFT_279513 [Aspergillus pseudonomiae]